MSQLYCKPLVIMGAISFYLICSPVLAKSGESGFSAAFLGLGAGARVLGMGNAFVGLGDDSTAAYWNVAGTTQAKSKQFCTMHSRLTLDRSYDFINYIQPLIRDTVYGVSWIRFGVDNIEERDDTGKLLGTFEDTEDCLIFSYAWKTRFDFSLGTNFKYIQQKLYQNSAWACGLDIGIFYPRSEKFNFGAVVRDLATNLKWDTAGSRTDHIPFTLAAGISFLPKEYLTLALDISKTQHMSATVHFGAEGWINRFIALRGGINDGDICLGLGLRWKDRFQFDYGFSSEDLGEVHRISCSIEFDK